MSPSPFDPADVRGLRFAARDISLAAEWIHHAQDIDPRPKLKALEAAKAKFDLVYAQIMGKAEESEKFQPIPLHVSLSPPKAEGERHGMMDCENPTLVADRWLVQPGVFAVFVVVDIGDSLVWELEGGSIPGVEEVGGPVSGPEEVEVEEKILDEWQEIPIDAVQPGDVARCNGREFPVEGACAYQPWAVLIGSEYFYPNEPEFFKSLGVTFHRRVKRQPLSMEPMSGDALVRGVGEFREIATVDLPDSLIGKTIRWEVLP